MVTRTKQIRIDAKLQQVLKIDAAKKDKNIVDLANEIIRSHYYPKRKKKA